MQKRIWMVFAALMMITDAGYAFYNDQINAHTAAHPYYEIGDVFERGNQANFTIGPLQWHIAYTDPASGTAIVLSENAPAKASCKNASANYPYVSEPNVAACIVNINNLLSSNEDDMGKYIKQVNSFSASAIKVSDYDLITNREASFSHLPSVGFWLDDVVSDANVLNGEQRVLYQPAGKEFLQTRAHYMSHDYLVLPRIASNNAYSDSSVFAAATILLPQKGILKTITSTQSEIMKLYSDSWNESGTVVSNIDTSEGEGPYHFYLYDTNASGAGTYTSPSAYFALEANASDGTAKIVIDQKLAVGDYYFKVKVVDESPNERLYYAPDDFSEDPYRSKETGVIHVKITKEAPSLSFTDPNQLNIKIGDSPVHETITTDHGELSTSGANMPVYTLSGGVSGTGLNVANDPSDPKGFIVSVASSTSATLPQTFTLNVTTPTTANYQGSTATKKIYVFKALSALTWIPSKSGSYAPSDVSINALVGQLLASDGMPNYTYALAMPGDVGYNANEVKDNSSFIVDNTPKQAGVNASVKVASALGAGEYHIQFKVTDENGDVLYQHALIKVSANSQPALNFKENGSIITRKTIYFDDTDASVKAEGGLSGISTLPQYTLSDNQPNGINASEYLEVNPTTGLLVPKGITQPNRPIRVKATKAGNAVYSDVSAEIDITILPAKQSIAFENSDNPRKIKVDDTTVSEIAQGVLTSNGAKGSGIGSITYTSSDPSIAEIDPDSGSITPHKQGTITITATLNDADNSDCNRNYESATVSKQVYIYEGMAILFQETTPHLKAESSAKADAIAGKVSVSGNSGNVSYAISSNSVAENADGSLFRVDALGQIHLKNDIGAAALTVHGVNNSYKIRVEVSDNNGTQSIDIEVHIQAADNDFCFVDPNDGSTKIHEIIKRYETNGTFPLATKSSNGGTVSYKIKDGADQTIITLNGNTAMIQGVGTTIIEATVSEGSGYGSKTIELPITIQAVEQGFIYTDSTLQKELPKTGSHYRAYSESYEPNKSFHVYTAGNPQGTVVSYRLKTGSPSDVIAVDSDGMIHILNASLNTQIGKVIVEATSHDPAGNYEDKTIELPINIEKGTRKIEFAEYPVNVVNGGGSVTPNILVDGTLDTSGSAVIEIDSGEDNGIAWTNDGTTIHYRWEGEKGKDIKLHVTKSADRNYKPAEADGILHILGAEESALTLSTPGKIIYGDHFAIRCTQDDSMSTNVQYAFETDNGVFISAPQINGNKAEFDALAYSGSTEVTIKVTRSADGELPLTKSVKIKVLPKPITIEIEDKEKKRLEENPPLTYKDFKDQLVEWNGVKDTINESVIKLSTTAGKYSPEGTYPISAKNARKQLNDNYPNYTFTIKEGKLNIKDNGNKDFWDIDDDGCPDLNITISDDEGNTILINGDTNDDGIPDYNIDTNGDGKPDLNIDTDNDGKPDVNLVILKEWKPSKCVTLGDIQYAGGISAKAEINIDTDGDLIPDINIDNKGDFQPHINISKDGRTPQVNIAMIHVWKPRQDYQKDGLCYDSIAANDREYRPILNIDTDNDGRADVNIDLDNDGQADINVDVGDDLIPDVNIDGNGDGQADINIDKDGDGTADENIIEITEWKPEHNVNDPFAYDTMKLISRDRLEDNGITVEKSDKGTFLPNMALKVIDVTKDKKAEVADKASDLIKEDQEIEHVYEVKLLENGMEVKPDGTLKIRIPIKEGIVHPLLLRQNAAGEYEIIDADLEDGYLVYESDELGMIAIIADRRQSDDNVIKGSYYPGGSMGGAITGDDTAISRYAGYCFLSLGILCFLRFKHIKHKRM